MNQLPTRDHYVAGADPDWSLRHHRWQPLTQRETAPVLRALTERRRWDTNQQAYTAGLRRGWLIAAVFYAIGTTVLILAFRFLGGAS